MRLTIHVDAVVARVKARRAREAALRQRGVAILRDWLKRRIRPKGMIMRLWIVLASVLLTGCGMDHPTIAPSSLPAHGLPARIELSAMPGVGVNGGSATITARVQDAYAATLPDVSVAFGTNTGTFSATTVTTNSSGIATTTLTADPGTVKVTAVADTASAPELPVAIQPVNVFVPAPSTPPPPQPPTAPPTSPQPFYGVSVIASPTSVVTGASTTLTATVTGFNNAPAVASWVWDCDTSTPATNSNVANSTTCTYATTGTFTVGLRVSGGSAVGFATTTVTVTAPPLPPVVPIFVSVAASPSGPVKTGTLVTFTATLSSVGPLPTRLQFDWDDQNDGVVDATTTSNTRTVTVVAAGTAIWKTSVKVTDLDSSRAATGLGQLTVTP